MIVLDYAKCNELGSFGYGVEINSYVITIKQYYKIKSFICGVC